MSIVVCGDTHGIIDIRKVEEYFSGREDEFTKEDYLIICGDVAICGFNADNEKKTRKALRNLPVTVLFCDGNHENFDKLNDYPVEEWHGGKVHMIEPDIIHLMRGQIFNVEGKTFFVFGGAFSMDRDNRVQGVTWFEQELPCKAEMDEAWDNLRDINYNVDYVITHTAPYEVVLSVGYEPRDEEIEQMEFLQEVADELQFKKWFFGHFHEDVSMDNYICLMDEIVELM